LIKLTSKDVADAANRGDKLALVLLITQQKFGQKFEILLRSQVPKQLYCLAVWRWQAIIIIKPTKKYMEESMLSIFKNKVKIIPSALPGGNAAVLGASALIWNEIKKIETENK
jgi:glucokinase